MSITNCDICGCKGEQLSGNHVDQMDCLMALKEKVTLLTAEARIYKLWAGKLSNTMGKVQAMAEDALTRDYEVTKDDPDYQNHMLAHIKEEILVQVEEIKKLTKVAK